jgi:hypothetical protein
MCEILLLWYLCRKMEDIVGEKGYGAVPFQIAIVAIYLLGALFGGMIGFAASAGPRGAGGGAFFAAYAVALLFALMGVGAVFFVALILPEQKERDYMDDYYNYRQTGRKKTRRRAEEDDRDGRPRRRRYEDDDDRDRDRYDDRDRPRRRYDDYDDRDRRYDDRDRDRDHDDRPRRRDDDRYRHSDEDDRPRRRRDDDRY